MVKLQKHFRVSYVDERHAREAWEKLLKNFPALSAQQNSNSHLSSGFKNNTVRVVITGTARDNLIKKFLLSQEGAQPEGCNFPEDPKKENPKKAAAMAKPSKK